MSQLVTLRTQHEDLMLSEWDATAGMRYMRAHQFTETAYALMPDLLEAVAVLRNKMNPLTNDQENHNRALKVLEKLDAHK